LFPGSAVAVSRPGDGEVRCVAIAEDDAARAERWRDVFPFPLTRDYIHGSALLDCRVVDVADVLEEGGQFGAGKRNLAPAGYRAMTVVPMVRDATAIGAIAVVRTAPGLLSAKQLALLQTFADQAVIAIENVRLFNETKEALEQQKTSADVLSVISNSVSDSAPVFEAIVQSCQRLFGSGSSIISLVGDDGMVRHEAIAVAPNAHATMTADEARRYLDAGFPRPLAESYQAYPLRKREVVHYPDMLHGARVPESMRTMARLVGNFSMLIAPMLWEGRGIGTIHVVRFPPIPFTEKETSLLRTFADQAVIAIQNARLFRRRSKRALQPRPPTRRRARSWRR
jgi:GAF domain-containing protein